MSQNGKLAIDLVQKLERDIVTGVLKPGDKLDERSLSERFGVSRTPVREALQTLAGSGLVATMPRRGYHCGVHHCCRTDRNVRSHGRA